MNATSKLERVRELARSKMMQTSPFAGEEMDAPRTEGHREAFLEGEHTLAAQILEVLDAETYGVEESEALEEAMVLGR